ncbi:MAG: twin-arginine translocase subunit TatC [Alphaproteobacteria bacterium]
MSTNDSGDAAASGEADGATMPLLDHLIELRRRLMWCAAAFIVLFFACFGVAEELFNFLVEPLAHLWEGQEGRRLIYTALHEKFFTDVKVAFFAAAFLSFPVIASQIWRFVAPGLYRREKAAFLPFLLATPVLFFSGGAFVYYIVMPLAWQFFAGFEQAAGGGHLAIQLEPKVNEYLGLVMRLIFAFGLTFEMPVVLTLLVRAGLVGVETLKAKRRYAIVIAFIAAAILTPPDPLSQLALAIPMIGLYEVSIWISVLMERRARRTAEREEAAAQ